MAKYTPRNRSSAAEVISEADAVNKPASNSAGANGTSAFKMRRATVYAPIPRNAPCTRDNWPANPPIRFQACAIAAKINSVRSTV